jgi:hypothetical protein
MKVFVTFKEGQTHQVDGVELNSSKIAVLKGAEEDVNDQVDRLFGGEFDDIVEEDSWDERSFRGVEQVRINMEDKVYEV